MLKTIQIIAVLQGILVISVLLVNRKDYKKTTFWLLFGCLLSVLFFITGDDDNNLFVQNADWFLFDSSLFVTFLFLFFRYFKSGKEKFAGIDYLFFIPNILYFIIEATEIVIKKEYILIDFFEKLVEITFVLYLL